MKKQLTITINGTAFALKFGYRAMRLLGEYLGIDTYDGTANKIGQAIAGLAQQEKEGQQLPFEVLDTIGFMVLAAIVDDEAAIGKADIVDAVFDDMEQLKPIIEAWAASMPKTKAAPQKKRTPRKATASR